MWLARIVLRVVPRGPTSSLKLRSIQSARLLLNGRASMPGLAHSVNPNPNLSQILEICSEYRRDAYNRRSSRFGSAVISRYRGARELIPMRIIAGERRGHKIDGPKGHTTRPTSDLVRESVFNLLRQDVPDCVVVDLFAGTGALGLEALSRGASRAIFVEQNRSNVALIHRNLATLRYEDRGHVLTGDAYRWVRAFVPIDEAPMVVLLDPPYREYDLHAPKVNRLLAELIRKLPDGSVILVESGRILDESVLPDLDSWDVRRYGGTQVGVRAVTADDRRADVDDPGTRDDDLDSTDAESPDADA